MAKKTRGARQTLRESDEQVLGIDFPELDPEGWMAERPNYWLDLPDPPPPTRTAWLRHRIAEAAAYFGMLMPAESPARVSEEEWIRLSEMALGPLPRPQKAALKSKGRSAAPNAIKPAREPNASSPATRAREPAPR